MVLDVLILVPAGLILLASFQNNQRKKFARLLNCFFAFGITLSIFAFNLFGVPAMIMDYADLATPLLKLIPASYRTAQTANFYVYAIILIISLVLYLLFALLTLLFSKERKRMKNPLYAQHHRWFLGLIVGVLRAVIVTYAVVLLVRFTLPLTNFDASASFVISFAEGFDAIYPKLVDTISGLTVPWIV